MLSILNKVTNISASSLIEDGEANHIVMYFNATVSASGDLNITQSIRDKELYVQNKETVDADFDEFRNSVISIS